VCLFGIPATVGLAVLAGPMIAAIYYHGGFSANGVRMAAASLVAYAAGLTAIVMVKILAPGFYAHQNTKTPVRIAMIAVAANIALSLLLVWPMRHVGLALATSLAAYLNAGLLYAALRKARLYRPEPGWGGFLFKVGAAAAAMGALIIWGGGDTAAWLAMPAWQRAVKLMLWVGLGAALYFGALHLMGVRLRALWLARETAEA